MNTSTHFLFTIPDFSSRDEAGGRSTVANVLGTTISTASHHLSKLRDLRLLKYRNDGKMSYYSLRNKYAAKLAIEVVEKVKVD